MQTLDARVCAEMEVMMILECENLSKNYGSVKALDKSTLKIESGKIVGLLGPNGHGKTTLIKTLSGLLSKDKGKVPCGQKDRGRDKENSFISS